jgi:hypothetical protein
MDTIVIVIYIFFNSKYVCIFVVKGFKEFHVLFAIDFFSKRISIQQDLPPHRSRNSQIRHRQNCCCMNNCTARINYIGYIHSFLKVGVLTFLFLTGIIKIKGCAYAIASHSSYTMCTKPPCSPNWRSAVSNLSKFP